MRAALAAAVVLCAAGAAQALDLELPSGARQVIARDTGQDRYFAPIAPFAQGVLPTQMVQGAVARSAWRVDVAGLTPLQLVTPLRAQLEAAGYDIVLDCAAQACGGYDFRFETEVLPAPNMYVNIRNFHVITGLRSTAEAVTVLASASSGASFVQIIQAGEAAQGSVRANAALPVVQRSTRPAVQGDADGALLRQGHLVLDGLTFESGTSALGAGPFRRLEDLAEVLRARPEMRVALVGHTDNVGSLERNIALSRARARAVRARLVERFGLDAARLEAEGMGYLSPLTTNATPQGREANRRVEVIVLAP